TRAAGTRADGGDNGRWVVGRKYVAGPAAIRPYPYLGSAWTSARVGWLLPAAVRGLMPNDVSIPVGEALRVLRRGLAFSLAVAVILGYLTYIWSARQDPVYESQATVLASSSTADFRSFGVSPVVAPPIDVSAYQVAARSDPVVSDALLNLGREVDDDAIRRLRSDYTISASDSGSSSLITVTARSGSPEQAAAIANAVAQALVGWDVERATRSVAQIVAALEQQVASLTEQIRSLQTL